MKHTGGVTLLVLLLWIAASGCGGSHVFSPVQVSSGCPGAVFSGTLRDSLTGQPVAQGIAVLETGTQSGSTPVYNFLPTQQIATDTQGAFSLCAQQVPYPSVLVLEAKDAGGKIYPPFVQAVTGAAKLGTIAMGGCALTCGFVGQEQTSTPATITGVITSAPLAMTGAVVPFNAMLALDGSKTADGLRILWDLALPVFIPSPAMTFSTTAGACGGAAPFCSTFTLTVPAQSPIFPSSNGTIQSAVPPTYLISAAPESGFACTPAFGITAFQTDGKSPLTATPGAQLAAQSVALTNCK